MASGMVSDLVPLALELCACAAQFGEIVKKSMFHGHAPDMMRLQDALRQIDEALSAAEAAVEAEIERG